MKRKRIAEAIAVLKAFGLPKEQHNDRSALSLLALLNLSPRRAWADCQKPLMGITPIMEWMTKNYAKRYKPNTRETVRRQTMHQFVLAGVALYNPDDPSRPINSPKAVYRISPAALNAAQAFGTPDWEVRLADFLSTSHGPVDGKRPHELKHLFANVRAGLVYVTAFASRAIMSRYLSSISWETEVWVAEAPTHLIHFNGSRFLGPHSS